MVKPISLSNLSQVAKIRHKHQYFCYFSLLERSFKFLIARHELNIKANDMENR